MACCLHDGVLWAGQMMVPVGLPSDGAFFACHLMCWRWSGLPGGRTVVGGKGNAKPDRGDQDGKGRTSVSIMAGEFRYCGGAK